MKAIEGSLSVNQLSSLVLDVSVALAYDSTAHRSRHRAVGQCLASGDWCPLAANPLRHRGVTPEAPRPAAHRSSALPPTSGLPQC